MYPNKSIQRKKICCLFVICVVICLGLMGRLAYLMLVCESRYQRAAEELHQRERSLPALRGEILDATGEVLATNRTVCTVFVIHNQIREKERVIQVLSKELEMDREKVRQKVEKLSSIEKIKGNVEKKVGDRILQRGLAGVKVDVAYQRYYPNKELASKVLGFTGGENQGVLGLEAVYDELLRGKEGSILTRTDARGVEIEEQGETRREPENGQALWISIDHNIQSYAQQAAEKVWKQKQAQQVSLMVLDPKNGEILAMVNVPEFDLNHPFELPKAMEGLSEKEREAARNQMWRNPCINDTYEPGSTFKVITASAALESNVVELEEHFNCPGYKIVKDRRIRCHKTTGHGPETFVQAIENSCNPVFIELGQRIGVEDFWQYFQKFGLLDRTGVDLPGEAGTIMHRKEDIGEVELATISFGQSFQITPLKLATTVSSIINGGRRITPHFAVRTDQQVFSYPQQGQIVRAETSEKMRFLLEKVVSEGGGHQAAIEGYEIGGKTATSQTLPRSAHKYIASFVGFAPAKDPKILAMVVIWDPKGTYYGGIIAAPVIREVFENILPYYLGK